MWYVKGKIVGLAAIGAWIGLYSLGLNVDLACLAGGIVGLLALVAVR
jgi:prepilin signal peptidase PulO-like enzyme (type II secretory pathway)